MSESTAIGFAAVARPWILLLRMGVGREPALGLPPEPGRAISGHLAGLHRKFGGAKLGH
jgi:hypothetical protein